MSAALQPQWLKSVDTVDVYDDWIHQPCAIPPDERTDRLWAVTKSATTDAINAKDAKAFADRILAEHAATESTEFGRITLVVCNTVKRSCETHAALQDARRTQDVEA